MITHLNQNEVILAYNNTTISIRVIDVLILLIYYTSESPPFNINLEVNGENVTIHFNNSSISYPKDAVDTLLNDLFTIAFKQLYINQTNSTTCLDRLNEIYKLNTKQGGLSWILQTLFLNH